MLETGYNLVGRYTPTPTILDPPLTVPQGMPSPFPAIDPSEPTDIYTMTLSPNTGMVIILN